MRSPPYAAVKLTFSFRQRSALSSISSVREASGRRSYAYSRR